MTSPLPGTVVIYGPFFARTGFGILARGWAMALHQAGVTVRIVPVDCNDPNASGDLDDCDLYLLQSLKFTPLTQPVTAIFAYVPTYVWPKIALPEPNHRILLTTFDSSADAATPPPRLIFIGNQMDQVWVANPTEEQAWIRGGLNPGKISSFRWPHEWIDNPQLGAPVIRSRQTGEPFRFLHISLWLPRRRLDVLIRAFLEEFPGADEAELYLKMSYPSWHPVPGKPKRDLLELIERLQRTSASRAKVIVDESLGTRLELARLIDRCDAYVSADTTHTAPVTEAIVRDRPVIITDGWGVDLPPQALVIPNSAERVPLTPEMAQYMPHQRGTSFPALDAGLMRKALRQVFAFGAEDRRERVRAAAQYMRERYSYAATAPAAIAAIRKGWEDREAHAPSRALTDAASVRSANSESGARASGASRTDVFREARPKAPGAGALPRLKIHWSGLQLFYGKIPAANREICLELLRRGHQLSLTPGHGPFHIEELDLNTSPKYRELARWFYEPLAASADFNVSFRWHPVFNEHAGRHSILASTWWHGAIPVDWIKPIGAYTREVWVPSRFVLDNFTSGGIAADQLHVIPPGIDPRVFCPDAKPFPLQTKKRFKFLFVGETTQRKGFDLLLAAYAQRFTRRDDVCLVIKDMNCEDYYARAFAAETIRKCQADPRCPEIEYLATMQSEEDVAGLYTACDCLVQPHRAASFSLAVLEAMACGLPVITTEYGGVLEVCRKESTCLLPAREIRRRNPAVGHWKVSGEQRHAEPDPDALLEQMDRVFRNPSEMKRRARSVSEQVRKDFSWARTVDRIEERFQALQSAPERSRPPVTAAGMSAPTAAGTAGGPTVVIAAPFYNRSGYGVAARALAAALHGAGMKIRTLPVDNVEDGIDDCDLEWLKSLEQTPVKGPVVAIFFHVPSPQWLKVQLPPQSLRVLFTTFDSSAQGNLPPPDWISICNQMDQLWLMTEKEAAVFSAAGVPDSRIHLVKSPHPWIHNPVLPLPPTATESASGRFRFLCISMFLPRRRWDTLVEAFLSEFKDTPQAELYLKVNYPSWHPVPGQPQRDLRQLIETLRTRTASQATVTLDETLDTRLGICRLIDSCDAYVSTDTSITAPVGEAFVRGKVAVIPDGFGITLPYCEGAFVIPVDPRLTQPMTEEMLAYQPHHRGKSMPLLRVEDVRRTLREAYQLPPAERRQRGHLASLIMECAYGSSNVLPGLLKAIHAGLREKSAIAKTNVPAPATIAPADVKVDWIGSFLDHGSLSQVNRELTQALRSQTRMAVKRITNGAPPAPDAEKVWPALAHQVVSSPSADAAITVRHAWPPDWKRPARGKLAVIQPWEFGSLPEEWVRKSIEVDEFWVPSKYVRDCYVSSGVPAAKVQVVPNGIDPQTFHPQVPPMSLASTKKFKFLFVGGTIGRKGPDVLLDAYLASFTAADDVCLVIKDFGGKTVYTGQTIESEIRAVQERPEAPEILYLNEEMAPDRLPGLYTACQCLVLPYRGEGFGLPVLEAMACGLPVIVTAGGATDDFASDQTAFRIPSQRRLIGREVSGMKLAGEGWLLEPDLAALAERMKWVIANPDAARAKGRAAGEHARRNHTWSRAAEIAQLRIQALAERSLNVKPAPAKMAPAALPPCARIGDLSDARARFGRRDLKSAWTATLEALRQRPFHPEAFLGLAEIALLAGNSAMARQCAQRALDLAPGWKSPKQFLQKSLKGNTRSDWLVLPEPFRKSKSTAHSRLSVCVIAKNEEQFLDRCLSSVKNLAAQIIVVDTGSTDRTVEIARSHGAQVYDFKWCDDFGAVRNRALEHASGDWILMLDADEELPPDQQDKLKADIANGGIIGYRLPLVNEGHDDGQSYVPRLYRNAPGVYYRGRIHEQVFPSLLPLCKTWGIATGFGTACLLHRGYTKEIVKVRNKNERNLRLLHQAISEDPQDANLLMNLGLELVRSGDLAKGLEQYREAFRVMSAQPADEVVPELCEVLLTQFTSQLYKVRDHAEVVRVLNSPLARNGGLTGSLHFALGLSCYELKQFAEAAEQMRQCLAKRLQPALSPINTDILTSAPNHCLALSLTQTGDIQGAHKAFEAALTEKGDLEKLKLDYARFLVKQDRPVDALRKLHEILGQNSQCATAWRLGGEIALRQPEFLEFGRDWTGEAIRYLPNDDQVISQRAEALLLSGDAEGARPFWARVCKGSKSPRSLAALILCGVVEAEPEPETCTEAEETAASRSFVEWYQKLVQAGQTPLIERINTRVDALQASLPTAAQMLDSALAEVQQQPA